MNKIKTLERRCPWLRGDRILWVLLALLLAERLLVLLQLGPYYTLESDDRSYINSGIYFANTGTVTMHESWPSAQIMPGMPILIGVVSFLFGEGRLLMLVLKALWIAMGTATGWFLYHSVRAFCPRWCAVLAVLPLFRPDFALTDNLILTETPFILCFAAMIYFTLQMGREGRRRQFVGCIVAYLLAIQFKANIGLYPAFAAMYLLMMRYPWKKLLRQGVILGVALLCVLTPWTVRNYIQFDALIPLTYGAGNPQLLGTYQGYGYPDDSQVDFAATVTPVLKERYARYYNEDGTIQERFQRYVLLEEDGLQAKERMRVWWETNPKSMLHSYLLLKPWQQINSIYYTTEVLGVPHGVIDGLQRLDLFLCIAAVAAVLAARQHRAKALFLLLVYGSNVALYAMTFVYGRYNQSLMIPRFLLIAFGAGAAAAWLQRIRMAHK